MVPFLAPVRQRQAKALRWDWQQLGIYAEISQKGDLYIGNHTSIFVRRSGTYDDLTDVIEGLSDGSGAAKLMSGRLPTSRNSVIHLLWDWVRDATEPVWIEFPEDRELPYFHIVGTDLHLDPRLLSQFGRWAELSLYCTPNRLLNPIIVRNSHGLLLGVMMPMRPGRSGGSK